MEFGAWPADRDRHAPGTDAALRQARGGGPNPAFASLPAFCRVAATLTPSSDSDIKIEVWLPTSGWNGKYQAVGNGAWQGSIGYAAMAEALRRGYATSSTDTGHVGGSASFGMGKPRRIVSIKNDLAAGGQTC